MIDLIRRITAIEKRLDGLIKPEVGRWMDWTPTVTQSASVTFTNTFSRYTVSNKTVTIRIRLAITSAGTITNGVIIGGLPIAPRNASGTFGVMRITDSGTATYVGAAQFASASTISGIVHNAGGVMGIVPNFALASGDTIDIVGQYEIS